jgi:alcohol dehydrogenase class IV
MPRKERTTPDNRCESTPLRKDPELRQLTSRRSISDLGDILAAVVLELGIPRALKEIGTGRDGLDRLAENNLRDHRVKANAKPIMEKSHVMEILGVVE